MFSARVLTFAVVLTAVAALPASDKPAVPRPVTTITDADVDDAPWFSFPYFGNLFAPLFKLFPTIADIGPRIIADDDKFQVIVGVKDYKKEDLKVKVKGDFIFVQGSHEAKQDDRDIFASQFFHTYTLPANSSAAAVTAELSSDGFLIVSAPIGGAAESTSETDREVPITETGAPYLKEESTTTVVPLESENDKKESTTQSEREEVTEKDNVIPHGNEIPV
uniref:Heat shock protein 23.9 n=1 Tax=Chilo suppressalis TaxID=168631 RepID=A0A514MHU4_CHISP|nr:heat shock protein 23.9 [Chilo suppressalis]